MSPLEKEMATHSNILAGKSRGQRSPAGYSPVDSQRVEKGLAAKQQLGYTFVYICIYIISPSEISVPTKFNWKWISKGVSQCGQVIRTLQPTLFSVIWVHSIGDFQIYGEQWFHDWAFLKHSLAELPKPVILTALSSSNQQVRSGRWAPAVAQQLFSFFP